MMFDELNMPCRLSVITPVCNGVHYIEDNIRNVIGQHCAEAEHIIIDGGSIDGTVDVIKRYAEQYHHIRWVSEKDKGQSDAMNKGIHMARSNILGFLNVDDYYEPGTLQDVLALFKNLPEPSLLVGNCNVWDNEGHLSFLSRPSKIGLKNLLLGKYMEAFPMNPSAYFYHKALHERIGPYETDEHYGMDVHFIFKSLQHAAVTYVDKTWGNYRYLEGTKTHEDSKKGHNMIRVKRITEHYRRQQKFLFRLYLSAAEPWNKMIRFARKALLSREGNP